MLCHVPPAGVLAKVIVEPIQTVAGPVIAPIVGMVFTVIVFVAATVPQKFTLV